MSKKATKTKLAKGSRNPCRNPVVTGTDLVGQFECSSTGAFELTDIIQINPGIASTFPNLYHVARGHTHYRFRRLKAHFTVTSLDTNSMMWCGAWTEDTSASYPESIAEMAIGAHRLCPAKGRYELPIGSSPWLSVRETGKPDHHDYDFGVLRIGGIVGSTVSQYGFLEFSYQVEFKGLALEPQVNLVEPGNVTEVNISTFTTIPSTDTPTPLGHYIVNPDLNEVGVTVGGLYETELTLPPGVYTCDFRVPGALSNSLGAAGDFVGSLDDGTSSYTTSFSSWECPILDNQTALVANECLVGDMKNSSTLRVILEAAAAIVGTVNAVVSGTKLVITAVKPLLSMFAMNDNLISGTRKGPLNRYPRIPRTPYQPGKEPIIDPKCYMNQSHRLECQSGVAVPNTGSSSDPPSCSSGESVYRIPSWEGPGQGRGQPCFCMGPGR
jgi:hypothetical protein